MEIPQRPVVPVELGPAFNWVSAETHAAHLLSVVLADQVNALCQRVGLAPPDWIDLADQLEKVPAAVAGDPVHAAQEQHARLIAANLLRRVGEGSSPRG